MSAPLLRDQWPAADAEATPGNGRNTFMALCASNNAPDAYLRGLADQTLADLIAHLEAVNATGGIQGMVLGLASLEAKDRFVKANAGGGHV